MQATRELKVAAEFSRQIRETLTAEELLTVVRRNLDETDPSICHSHDFCDPNQSMLDALAELGIEWNGAEDEDTNKLIDAAWAVAKASMFLYGYGSY